jgi:LacI family transcriptional regulator
MNTSTREPLRLALFLNTREHWGRTIARGAVRAARLAGDWMPFVATSVATLETKATAAHEGVPWAGLIGQFYPIHHPLIKSLRAAGIYVINVSSTPPPPRIGWVHCDDVACGAMAARHFLERGYRHFAFLGMRDAAFAEGRKKGFLQTLAGECPAAQVALLNVDSKTDSKLVEELRSLPTPCAIFAANDVRARHCLQAAQTAGIAVPEALAILGVDDDDLECNMARVALSSVRQDWERVGERAMDELVRLVRTRGLPARSETIPPLGISVRQSTDQLAVEDALAARALQRIHRWGESKISAEILASELGVSRRTLERHMELAVGRSVHAAILEARLQRAYRMVVETRLPVGEIAARTGFSKHSHLNAAFKKRFETTPMSLRRAKAREEATGTSP